MKKILSLAIAISVLSGCQMMKTEKVTSEPINVNITIDMKYLQPKSLKDALSNIEGFGSSSIISADNDGSNKPVRLSNEIYISSKDNSANFAQFTVDNSDGMFKGITDKIDSLKIQFTEDGNGVYISKNAQLYQWNKVDPLGAILIIKENSDLRKVTAYTAENAIDDLKKTYSVAELEIKSKYSRESVESQLTRELKAHKIVQLPYNKIGTGQEAAFVSHLVFNGDRLSFKYTVEPYRTGAIIIARVDVPVKVDGTTFTYGADTKLDEIKSFIQKILEY